MKDISTITLKVETKERLEKHGSKGESFDELVNKVLDAFEKNKR